jgi:hypothetical protein
MSEKDMYHTYHDLKRTASIKTAIHGHGETWTPVDSNYNPYKTSPLVNSQGPEFGGRWRQDFPGAGDNHINDDSDKEKSGKGGKDDADPDQKNNRINELVEGIRGPKFIVRLRLTEEAEPNEDKAIEVFGDDGQSDGKSVYVVVDGFEKALEIQKKIPNCIIEPKDNYA